MKRRTEQRDEQRWRSATQQQLQQLLHQTAQLQRAERTAQQQRDAEDRAREERIERLDGRMERLIDAWEHAQQQQRKQQADKKRRLVMQRALQLSGSSGGKSEAQRALRFTGMPAEGRKEEAAAGNASKREAEARDAGELIVDGWVRNENQLIWLLQHSDQL